MAKTKSNRGTAAATHKVPADAELPLLRAMGIVDLLQGAAAHGAIEEPSNRESLARTLAVVRELLDQTWDAVLQRPGKAQP